MSLAIDVEKVATILLSDGWHVLVKKSFCLDSYEFLSYPDGYDHKKGWHQKDKFGGEMEPMVLHGGGNSGVCATGFSCIEYTKEGRKQELFGPLSSILAVSY